MKNLQGMVWEIGGAFAFVGVRKKPSGGMEKEGLDECVWVSFHNEFYDIYDLRHLRRAANANHQRRGWQRRRRSQNNISVTATPSSKTERAEAHAAPQTKITNQPHHRNTKAQHPRKCMPHSPETTPIVKKASSPAQLRSQPRLHGRKITTAPRPQNTVVVDRTYASADANQRSRHQPHNSSTPATFTTSATGDCLWAQQENTSKSRTPSLAPPAERAVPS
ncbi:uncharacterized protein LTR77_002554 [Saxophila tyrrhenica]|uniref:Uncharacterized protein n=1 Tax=Saxophila tyrrhenica TaxID=1690608 RepID=A0AAV9PNQ7_9PEZI|nr:hypothetical protein LTR77_002554 [Saxophila tyrrhenica]